MKFDISYYQTILSLTFFHTFYKQTSKSVFLFTTYLNWFSIATIKNYYKNLKTIPVYYLPVPWVRDLGTVGLSAGYSVDSLTGWVRLLAGSGSYPETGENLLPSSFILLLESRAFSLIESRPRCPCLCQPVPVFDPKGCPHIFSCFPYGYTLPCFTPPWLLLPQHWLWLEKCLCFTCWCD